MKSIFKSAVILSALYLSLLSTTASAGCDGQKKCAAEKINAAQHRSDRDDQDPGTVPRAFPPGLPLRIAKVESNYNPKARGSAGELGLYQLKCSTAREMGFRGNCTTLLNPAVNIHYGLKHLALAIKKSNGNLQARRFQAQWRPGPEQAGGLLRRQGILSQR